MEKDTSYIKKSPRKKTIYSKGSIRSHSFSSNRNKTNEDNLKTINLNTEDHPVIENHYWYRNDIPKADIYFPKHAEHKYKCECNLCQEGNLQPRERLELRADLAFFNNFDFESGQNNNGGEKDFMLILKKLMPPRNVARSLYLSIPETACFVDGECKFIVSTSRVKLSNEGTLN